VENLEGAPHVDYGGSDYEEMEDLVAGSNDIKAFSDVLFWDLEGIECASESV
jgi:hypothetical protein